MDTAYSFHESKSIQDLSWYQDDHLGSLVIKLFFGNNPPKVLVDLCCGPSILFERYADIFEKYIGVDNSIYMLDQAKINIEKSDRGCDAILFKKDVLEFCVDDLKSFHATHILIKNALQFFDARKLFSCIAESIDRDVTLVVVQTINDGNINIFPYLPDLNFTRRIKKFFKEEDILESIEFASGKTIDKFRYTQLIPLDEWLKYHQASESVIAQSLNALTDLSEAKKLDLGLVESPSGLCLKRHLAGYSINLNPSPGSIALDISINSVV